MIHPDTKIQFINESIGYGIFATRLIPKGTIVYVKDSLEIEISPESFLSHSDFIKDQIEKYSYKENQTTRIISWDLAKYVNHSCNPNTLNTGYEFEIAIQDILPGEEMTDDYGMLYLSKEMPCSCGAANCRKSISTSDPSVMIDKWNEALSPALNSLFEVHQPLKDLLSEEVKNELIVHSKSPNPIKNFKNLSFSYDAHLPA